MACMEGSGDESVQQAGLPGCPMEVCPVTVQEQAASGAGPHTLGLDPVEPDAARVIAILAEVR